MVRRYAPIHAERIYPSKELGPRVIHRTPITPGQTWSELRRFGDDVTVIAHDTAHGRVMVRRACGKRDVFIRARTLHRAFRLVSP